MAMNFRKAPHCHIALYNPILKCQSRYFIPVYSLSVISSIQWLCTMAPGVPSPKCSGEGSVQQASGHFFCSLTEY